MYSEKQQNQFIELIDSLKLAQRAEIYSQDKDIIKELYVDPMPNNFILRQMTSDTTTFLIGRRGTGKSTIISRAQDEIRESNSSISAYVDVKSIQIKSLSSIEHEGVQAHEGVDKLIALTSFIGEILKELVSELNKSLERKGFLSKISLKSKYDKCKEELLSISNQIKNPEYIDYSMFLDEKIFKSEKDNQSTSAEFAAKIGTGTPLKPLDASVSSKLQDVNGKESYNSKEFNKLLIREFNINNIMEKIRVTLEEVGLKKVFIFLDDFSEVNLEHQKSFVDVILTPLNNSSEKYYRFKVAAYPSRIYYGDLDISKIDELYLDYYKLYKTKNLNDLEDRAQDFMSRLLKSRFKYYDIKVEDFFSIDSFGTYENLVETLFHITMNIPRILGYIIYFCFEKSVIFGDKITKTVLDDASIRYYNEKISVYFEKMGIVQESYSKYLDRYGNEQLTLLIKNKAKELKSVLAKNTNSMFVDYDINTVYTSHFHTNIDYDDFFSTLELNYIINKYYEQKDRDGKSVSIYALNYGLCKQNSINFGRPKNDTKFRKYYIDRNFNYNTYLLAFLKNYKKLKCPSCGRLYEFEDYETLNKINMCYQGCLSQNVKFIDVYMFDDKEIEQQAMKEIRVSNVNYEILSLLKEDKSMAAGMIAQELDCTHQLVSARAKRLIEKDLLKYKFVKGRKYFLITPLTKELYFNES